MELEKIKAIIAEVLNIDADSITEDTTFVDDLGADSLDIFQIIMGIEEEYDIELDNESVDSYFTGIFQRINSGSSRVEPSKSVKLRICPQNKS